MQALSGKLEVTASAGFCETPARLNVPGKKRLAAMLGTVGEAMLAGIVTADGPQNESIDGSVNPSTTTSCQKATGVKVMNPVREGVARGVQPPT